MMNKKLIKMTILATASAFAIAPLAIAQDEKGTEKEPAKATEKATDEKAPDSAARGERGGRRGGERGGPGGPGGPGGFDREAMMKEFDKDGNGELNDEERTAMRAEMQKRFEKRSKERFTEMDADKNGLLSLTEYKNGNDRLGDRAEAMYNRLNTDGEDGLTQEEVAAARQARGPRGERPGGPRGERPGGTRGEGAGGEGAKGNPRPPADDGDKS